MSEVCDAFHCTPKEALVQDWTLVQGVFDYRNARAAVDLFNQGKKGLESLGKQPALMDLLVELHRAQFDAASLEWDDVRQAMERMPDPDEDEAEEPASEG